MVKIPKLKDKSFITLVPSVDKANVGILAVEPGVLKSKEVVLDEYEMMEMLKEGINEKNEVDDSGIIIEYVFLSEFVTLLDRDELIEGLMKKHAIQEIEYKYSYSLHLKEKIIRELRPLDMSNIFNCIGSSGYLSICISTGEIGFYIDAIEDEDYDNYEVEYLFTKVSEYNVPDKNIFSGLQFREAPIKYVTDEDYAQWIIDSKECAEKEKLHDEYILGESDNDCQL